MFAFISSLLLFLAVPSLTTTSASQESQVGVPRTPRDTAQDSIKVVISEGCATQTDSSDVSQGGKEISLAAGSPLVLTHKIKLVPSTSSSGPGSCGCEADFAALRERVERLEREVSTLREMCGGADGGCCSSKESKGAGCSIKSGNECPNDCSDQGRCVDGKCVCFSGYSGPDCGETDCPGNCNNKGRCVSAQCLCDPGFTGPDCSQTSCLDNCNNRGKCVNGRCVCDSGFGGPSCSDESCPGNCNNRGRCVNGQCVCSPGFTGPDCSKRTCPNNCNGHGRCVNGRCVCDSGFTGADCSELSCPGNCNDRGRCVNGQCACISGFTGADCSEVACLGNCNNRGRCVSGQCICDDGFTGPDCSEKTCPNKCSQHGRCVKGKCVCSRGFTGDDCSENSCPGNCNDRGRCVNGQCVCDEGFTAADCSEKTCPNNCSNRGKCVHGKCVCSVGFAGPDCSTNSCPNNCNNRGRCVKGRCVCRRGFTGLDCSLCEEGKTGPNCDIVMSGVTQLSTRDITQTSVTLLWTPPTVQYDTYHITFTSQKESDQQITVQVDGGLTEFTQTGLASGQEYSVTIAGEIDGRRGAQSAAEFTTLIPSPTDLQVVKMSTTSAVVQWEKPQGEIDRYHLTVTPRDGAQKKEMIVPVDQNSAHIPQLDAGRLYDIVLVAEKGTSRSEPVSIQAVPGILPRVTAAALNAHVTPAPAQDVGNTHQELNPSPEVPVFHPQRRRDNKDDADSVDSKSTGGSNKESSTSVIARTKPVATRPRMRDGTKLRVYERLPLFRNPNVPGHFNATRFVPKGRTLGSGPLKKTLPGDRMKAPIVPKKTKPPVPTGGDKTVSLTMSDPSVEVSRSERRDDKNTAIISGSESEPNRELPEQEDIGMAGQKNAMAPASSEPTGIIQTQDKKCMNKMKVTHSRFPLKERGNGCKEDEMVMVDNTLVPDQGSSALDTKLGDSEPDTSPDPLHKLLTDTYDRLNITMFSVHLAKPSKLSVDADTVKKQILNGLKPLASFSSSSSKSQSSNVSTPQSVAAPLSSVPPPSLSLATVSQVSTLPTIPPPLTSLNPNPLLPLSSLSASLSPSSSSNTVRSDSFGLSERDDGSKSTTTVASSINRTLLPSRQRGGPQFHLGSPKRYPIPKFKTPINAVPQSSPLYFNAIPKRETVTRQTSAHILPPSSAPEKLSLVEINAPFKSVSEEGVTTRIPFVVEQNKRRLAEERRQIPVRHFPPRKGYMRHPFPNMKPFQNQTHQNIRPPTHLSMPLKLKTETQKNNPVSSTELPALFLTPVSTDSYSTQGAEPAGQKKDDIYGTKIPMVNISKKLNQTVRGRGMPPSHHPATRIGSLHHIQQHSRLFTNKTNPNQRQYLHRGLRLKLPLAKKNSLPTTTESPSTQLSNESIPEIPAESNLSQSTQDANISQLGGKKMHREDTDIRPHTQTTKSDNQATSNPDTNLDPDIKKERFQGRPTLGLNFSDSRTLKTVIPSKKQPPTRSLAPKHHIPVKHISGTQRREGPKTSHATRKQFHKTEQTRNATSKLVKGPSLSSPVVVREPLDYVGLTNRTSDGFTLTWDSPEGKYKNFIVTTKGVVKELKQKESKKDQLGKEIDIERQGGNVQESVKHQLIRGTENSSSEDGNRLSQSVDTHNPRQQIRTTVKPSTSDKILTEVLPASTRSFRFEDLFPQTEYTVTLLGKGPGLLSKLHKLVISTGPEPPSNIVFSKVTENSLTVSWTKPKSPVNGFKVTYTNSDDGEPTSVSVDSEDSTVNLSQLSPGSTYEVSILSVLGLDESDPIKDVVMTLPDAPTNFQAVNITDTTALLLWRPALAATDKYAIVYGSGTGSEVRISVSGNAAEQQLSGLEGSTTYTVTITSQRGSEESPPATTTFTTSSSGSGGNEDVPRDLQANNVTPGTALLSWKPPSNPVNSYRMSYQTEGQETKEVMLDVSVTEYNLTRLHAGSKYTVQLQAERGGHYMSAISTDFTTGNLRFPFPSDCYQGLLNGIKKSGEVEIFPQGKLGKPLTVYCDMETDGGGWTVFQRRKDGSENFFRGWKDYVKGFGDVNGEFWLGLENLHNLTAMTRMSLRVDLRDQDESVFAEYSTFEVAKKNYRLTVGGYSGTAGDSLSYHSNRIFSTKDRDPLQFITRCAMSYRGGWWYKNCHEANLNGQYGTNVKHQGVIWTAWKGKDFSIPFAEMKMRPSAFSPPTRG